jgi:hypothetical protein
MPHVSWRLQMVTSAVAGPEYEQTSIAMYAGLNPGSLVCTMWACSGVVLVGSVGVESRRW